MQVQSAIRFYVSFEPPSYLSVMQCLLHAIKPKAYVKSLYPRLKNDWEAYGIPECIVVDNGPEFYSRSFKDACRQMGTTVLYSPPRTPKYKGAIERHLGTFNRQVMHRLPGTTFSNIFERKDYDPEKTAIFTLQEVLEILHSWIIDDYHQRVHRGLKNIPARVWKEGITKFPPALPQRREDLRILLGYVEYRSVSPTGIELFSLFYNCEDLGLLRREIKGEKVALKIDPENLSMIYAYDSKRDIYIPVPAVDQDYTRGLSLWQHKVIKTYARRLVQNHVDIEALHNSRRIIQEIVAQEIGKGNRIHSRTKIGRWSSVRQPDYSTISHSQDIHNRQLVESGEPLITLNSAPSPWSSISDIGNELARKGILLESSATRLIAERDSSYMIKGSPGIACDDVNKSFAPSNTESVDEELDITGFSASFDLPERNN